MEARETVERRGWTAPSTRTAVYALLGGIVGVVAFHGAIGQLPWIGVGVVAVALLRQGDTEPSERSRARALLVRLRNWRLAGPAATAAVFVGALVVGGVAASGVTAWLPVAVSCAVVATSLDG